MDCSNCIKSTITCTIDEHRHLVASSIAFDPTGQYGWISAAADVISDLEGTFDPIFYKSTDYGNTWSSVISLDLDSISGITYDPALRTCFNNI